MKLNKNETNAVVKERRRTLMADSTDHQNSGLGYFNVYIKSEIFETTRFLWVHQY